ncbi:MAG: ATPase domain-containing protein [Candidatus Micrarchaeia archaeon]
MAEIKIKGNDRVPTGIPGLDGMMEGGFSQGNVVLVAGTAGTGKSILATQFLVNGALKHGEVGVLITFEEKKRQIFRNMRRFGWDLDDLEKKKQLFVFEYAPHEVDKFINEGGSIEGVIRDYKVKRLVFDSITSFAALYETEASRRQAIIRLLDILRRWNCTTILPSEASVTDEGEGTQVQARFGVEYLADALLVIYAVRKGDIREMALEIVKMRGTDHSKKLAPMKITKEGIVLYPDQPFFGKSF